MHCRRTQGVERSAMGNILEEADRELLRRRLAALQPDAQPQFGRFTAPQMVCHQLDAIDLYLGRTTIHVPLVMRMMARLMKRKILYAPWPKGKVQAPPSLLATQPGEWAADVQRLDQAIAAFAQPPERWPVHPVLGPLTAEEWGVFIDHHFDHHFTQFGV
ncbi:MAG: DUF1569 domain-containing protein [Armatimonadetes bacterium]|nr:DUF1569 domain-containing protein [Armatimonadota bacterium]